MYYAETGYMRIFDKKVFDLFAIWSSFCYLLGQINVILLFYMGFYYTAVAELWQQLCQFCGRAVGEAGREARERWAVTMTICTGDCWLSVHMFIVVSGATVAVSIITHKIFICKDEVAFICI